MGQQMGQQALFDMEAVPVEKRPRVEALQAWLESVGQKERGETLRKAVEYGSSDLEVMGKTMLLLVPEDKRSRSLGLQMAIGFYALGKVARLFGSFEDAREPSSDTWYDLHIYALMGLKVQETGAWL
jgi:hypothetical protein